MVWYHFELSTLLLLGLHPTLSAIGAWSLRSLFVCVCVGMNARITTEWAVCIRTHARTREQHGVDMKEI